MDLYYLACCHRTLETDCALTPSSNIKIHQEETTPQILTARIDERYVAYQGFIRSTFAHHGSIMIVVPTAVDVQYASLELGQGIEDRVVSLSSLQTKRQRDKAYKTIEDTTSTKLIITTPAYAYIEREDLMAIIVEQAASGHYVTRQRPYLDHRDALTTYAKIFWTIDFVW